MKSHALPSVVAVALFAAFSSLPAAESSNPGSNDELVLLDQLEVSSSRARDADYKADRTRIGTKTDTALQDVPQSITIVTQEQILDQQMTSLADVVRYVPGVTSHQGENNRDQIIFRGNSSSADFFLNGVRDDVQYYRDLYNLDRVEVLRGPNAMMFGRGGGGGVINRASKEADFSTLRETTVQAGSFGQFRSTVDLNQPFSRTFAGRVNGLYERTDSFRHGVSLQRMGINPTVTFRPEKRTRVTLSYEHLRDRRVADRGITSAGGRPADVPFDTFYGNPDDSRVRATVNLATAAFEHAFAGGVTVRNRTMAGDYDRFYQNYVPGTANADRSLVALTAYNNATRRKNLFNQTDVVWRVEAGGITHTLLGGAEIGRQRTKNFRQTGYFNGSATTINVAFDAPTIATVADFRQSATDARNHLATDLGAVYLQDQIEFTRTLQAIAGLRFDSFALSYHNDRDGTGLARRDTLLSPRLGLVYKPLTKVSIYGSYSVSFLPSSGDQFSSLTTVTQQVKPEKFSNCEVGMKWDLRNNFSVTSAVYQLDRTNTRATDPNDPTRIIQTGSQRTNGLEVNVVGNIRGTWTASLGYAYQDAFISSATAAARQGAVVAQVPKHAFSFWNKVNLSSSWAVGLGLVHRTAMFATVDNSVTLPGYTRADAAVYYTLSDRTRLQLNVENLLDKKFFANADSNTNISPGAPRAIRVGLTTRF